MFQARAASNCLGRKIGMHTEPTITICCIRKNGRRESTKLSGHTMSDARDLARWLLYLGNDSYTEVDIYPEDGSVETILNPAVETPVWTT